MKAITLPDSIRQFVKEQVTIEIPPDDPVFPYSEYWWKAVVFLLLSGRIKSGVKKRSHRSFFALHMLAKSTRFTAIALMI